jgi:uncharacterized protein
LGLIGRNFEKQELSELLNSSKSEFILLYGRRRVGKTYLIKEYFNHQFTFYTTGLANKKLEIQLSNFSEDLKKIVSNHELEEPTSWMNAFKNLISALEKSEDVVKLVFIDELPWMDTKNSDLITAVDYFWNKWASGRKDIKLIVCGSSASWMIKNILKNNQGLYNRVTRKIKVKPFTLSETQEYFVSKGFNFDKYQIIELYMALGGIPYYLDFVGKSQSAAQNINRLFFSENAPLKNEYKMLFASLFKKYEKHMLIIEALATKKKGLQRSEILDMAKISDGGTFTKVLEELVESDFIRKFSYPQRKTRNSIYQLVDNFTLFYNNFKGQIDKENSNFWTNAIGTPTFYTWAGNAFEIVALSHIEQIKNALGISGIQTDIYAWSNQHAQIDLVIDRKDNVINLIEIKYSEHPYKITKDYDIKLRNKIASYKEENKTNKSVWLIFLTTFGLSSMANAGAVHSELKAEVLFK